MALIIGLALLGIGLWEELAVCVSLIGKDEDALFYAITAFLKLLGVFMALAYAVAHVYGE